MTLPSITLNKDKISNFEENVQKEWIITNGLGGYASSTVLGLNTRKYHGLLVAALNPLGERKVCLAKLDEEVTIENSTYPFGVNEFQNEIFPKGHLLLKEFSVAPFPKYVYTVKNVEVEKTVFMPYMSNAVVVLYRVFNKSKSDAKIRVFPLINWRHIHSVTDRWKTQYEFVQGQKGREVEMQLKALQSAVIMKATNGLYCNAGKWIEKLYYREEAQRGESCLDDCFQPGYFEVSVKAGNNDNFAIIVAADKADEYVQKTLAKLPDTVYDVESLYEKEMRQHESLLTSFYEAHPSISMKDWLSWIVLADEMFLIRNTREEQRSVLAGYHWFETWGRDTFVSLPGLMLVTGKVEDARKVFLTFQKYCKQGLIPNFLPERHEQPAYNSVDATLWFVNAILQYLKYTFDFRFIKDYLWETMKAIVENHVKGTLFDIRVDSDGLLFHGSRLTWMDAAVDGQAVTPRAGKAVEVQALWYNALKTMELLANKYNAKSEAEKYLKMAEKAKKSFTERFWCSEKNYLFDVISENSKDNSLRPNQVLAVALDFAILDNDKCEKIIDAANRELSTPYGLRSLARNDPRYMGVYSGDRRNRDKAYHNGTVWPWLSGPFITAFLKTKGYAEYRREYVLKNFVLPLFSEQVFKAGLGNVSEIFDGDPPHKPRGCIAQAWSVAEPLRAYVEDVMQVRPKYEREVLQGSR